MRDRQLLVSLADATRSRSLTNTWIVALGSRGMTVRRRLRTANPIVSGITSAESYATACPGRVDRDPDVLFADCRADPPACRNARLHRHGDGPAIAKHFASSGEAASSGHG